MKTTEITIDGTTYIADLDAAIKAGLIKEKKKPEVFRRRGEFYKYTKTGDVYLLSVVGYDGYDKCSVALICVSTTSSGRGQFWSDRVPVDDVYKITEEEWMKITAEKPFEKYEFPLVVNA